MEEIERLIEIWHANNSRHSDFSLHDFLEFCREWDEICKLLRRTAEME
jgi:hypothetical protein